MGDRGDVGVLDDVGEQRAGGLAGAAAGAVGDREELRSDRGELSATVAGSFSAPFGVRGGYSSNEIVGLVAGTENRLAVLIGHAHEQDRRWPWRTPSILALAPFPRQACHWGLLRRRRARTLGRSGWDVATIRAARRLVTPSHRVDHMLGRAIGRRA
ncbi:hypothetical protein GCM10027212_14330 [Actinotalea caeni]